MKKILTVILTICLICTVAFAEVNIDLSSMTDSELVQLRKQINEELNRREKERPEPELTEKERRDHVCDHFEDLSDNYQFQAIIDEINSGESGLSEECQADVLALATEGVSMLDGLLIESDIFTGELLIRSPLAAEIGGDTAVVPYLSKGYFGMIVGFPYEDSFSYDQINLKINDEVMSWSRKEFDIEFERIGDESWEYTYLSYVNIIGDDSLEAVGFREEDTTRKVDHLPTDAEKAAFTVLARIENISYDLYHRVLSWQYNPDPSEG